MIIADTNVVSDFMRDQPDAMVLAWAQGIAPADLAICVVTVEEIERGLGRLLAGKRRRELEERWRRLVDAFAESIVVYDVAAAREAAAVLVAAQASGGRCRWLTPRLLGSALLVAMTWPPGTWVTSRVPAG